MKAPRNEREAHEALMHTDWTVGRTAGMPRRNRPISWPGVDHLVAAIAVVALILALVVGLPGCGGQTDGLADGRVEIGPPDCWNHPQACQ